MLLPALIGVALAAFGYHAVGFRFNNLSPMLAKRASDGTALYARICFQKRAWHWGFESKSAAFASLQEAEAYQPQYDD